MKLQPIRPGAVVTHTTARIRGEQSGDLDVRFARTPEAFVSLTWSGILLRFRTANAAQGVLEGFAAARAHLIDVPHSVPPSGDPVENDFAVPTVQLTWERRTPYAVVKRDAYSDQLRRTLHWVDLHMGPITWQVLDRVGYTDTLDLLREAHRVAVATCLDGGRHRADPTKHGYRPPEPVPDKPRRRGATKKPAGADTAALIAKATNPVSGHVIPTAGRQPMAAPDAGNQVHRGPDAGL